MTLRRRDLLIATGAAVLSGAMQRIARAAGDPAVYQLAGFGNARILHMTDTHAQLLPVFFREPSVNLGIGAMQGQPPHLVGRAFLDRFQIRPDSADACAFTCLDFEKSAARFGKLGGFAHLKTLIDRLRSESGTEARRCCSMAAISGRAPASPTPCAAPTWWTPPTCSASRR